jgi:hypothetical protein
MNFFQKIMFMLSGGVQRMNADPIQQQFAKLLITAAEGPGTSGEETLLHWLDSQPWAKNSDDTRNRIAHAVSIVKISSLPATYQRVVRIAEGLHISSYDLPP